MMKDGNFVVQAFAMNGLLFYTYLDGSGHSIVLPDGWYNKELTLKENVLQLLESKGIMTERRSKAIRQARGGNIG